MTTGEPPHGTPSAAGCSGALMSREQNAKDNLVTKMALAHAPADLPFDGHSPNPAELSLCSKRHPPLRLSRVPGAAQSPARPARAAEGHGTHGQPYGISSHRGYSAGDRVLGRASHHIARADQAACVHTRVCWRREGMREQRGNKWGKNRNRSPRRRVGNVLLGVTKFSDWDV